jgi:CBS domain containing-hemolysin-like protein
MYTLLVILLALSTFVLISLQRTYAHKPIRQLRHLARQGDPVAQALYRAASYGHSLTLLLWFWIGIALAGLLVVITLNAPVWFAVAAAATVIWIGFLWLPARGATKMSVWLAKQISPLLAWLLNYLHPFFNKIVSGFRRFYPVRFHTGLYERKDLTGLIEQQRLQPDNRIDDRELAIAQHALTVSDKVISDILTPRRVVVAVSIEDSVGPLMMSELHESGLSRFPVYEKQKDNIVGTLYLRDLVLAKTGGTVRTLYHPEVKFIHEDQGILEAMQAMIKTRHHLLVVVNNFEEYVGVVSLEDVLEAVIGQQIVDEFDVYDDMRTAASSQAKKDHDKHKKAA